MGKEFEKEQIYVYVQLNNFAVYVKNNNKKSNWERTDSFPMHNSK